MYAFLGTSTNSRDIPSLARGTSEEPLYTYQTEPDPVMRSVDVARLSGDVLAVSILGKLLVTFWREDRTVVILDCFFEDVHLVDGYIIGVLQHYPDSAKLSICTFHWKPEAGRKRKGIHITLSVEINENHGACPTVDSFLLDIPTDTAGVSEFGSNDHLPSITHLERPGTMILYQRPSLYSNMSRPSQAGSMVIEFYADYEWGKRPNEWILATVSCGEEVACRTLEMPHARNAKVEFYSGALCFVMKNHKSIVIQYFD
ncbi:hypothetical protein DFH11DRAFT_1748419 [Phellopilus nigrolimitatus]|nr:hypothetical protein DFH11DRAFT_1748419 [Phellopilus nigrolimitatus]